MPLPCRGPAFLQGPLYVEGGLALRSFQPPIPTGAAFDDGLGSHLCFPLLRPLYHTDSLAHWDHNDLTVVSLLVCRNGGTVSSFLPRREGEKVGIALVLSSMKLRNTTRTYVDHAVPVR